MIAQPRIMFCKIQSNTRTTRFVTLLSFYTEAMGQVENSKTSENSEIFFRLFDRDLTHKIKDEKSEEETSGKKFRHFRAFQGFRVFDLPRFRLFIQASQI